MPPPEWPDYPDLNADLDALVADPAHHTLLFENDAVRVIETVIAAGETTPLHTHRWPGTLHLLSWSEIVRRDASGNVLMDSRTNSLKPLADAVTWSPSLALHTLENVGPTIFRAITTEIKHL